MNEPQYYILGGVRRCVAAREAGFRTMKARLFEAGRPPRSLFVPLSTLHSPKAVVSRSHRRYRDIADALATVQGRLALPEIVIELLGSPGQTGSIPLASMRLDP